MIYPGQFNNLDETHLTRQINFVYCEYTWRHNYQQRICVSLDNSVMICGAMPTYGALRVTVVVWSKIGWGARLTAQYELHTLKVRCHYAHLGKSSI